MACFDKNNFSFSPAKTVKIIGSELSIDHTEYVIKAIVGLYEWKVCRRYSEFLKLNDTLPLELKDVAKQLLPKKHLFGNNSETVIKDRQKKLEIYLQCLFRSLPKISYSLMQFLKFDVYEIHGITEFLTEELYAEGEEILSKNKTFNLSVLQLHAICKRMELPEPTSNGDPTRDIGHLLDFINRLRNLKVLGNREMFGMSNILPNDLWIHFQHFKSLQSMQFDNCNFNQISIDAHLRGNLGKLKVSNSLTCISEVLLAGLQWERPNNFPPNIINDYSWTNLENADFSSNKIHSLNASAGLLPKLKNLDLSHNCLDRIEIEDELEELRFLDVSHNKLEDASLLPRVNMSSLTELNISHNKLKSLTALKELKKLLKLNASYNEVESVEELGCLMDFPSLVEVKLAGNPISIKPDYRLLILHMFGERFHEITLDGQKVLEKEKDAILVRRAIQTASESFLKQIEGSTNVAGGGRSIIRQRNLRRKPAATEQLQHSYEARGHHLVPANGMISSASFPIFQGNDVEGASAAVGSEDFPAKFQPREGDQETTVHHSIPENASPAKHDERMRPIEDGGATAVGIREPSSAVEVEGSASEVVSGSAMEVDGFEAQDPGRNTWTVNRRVCLPNNATFSFGVQRNESGGRGSSSKHSRRRKYFLLPETLPNHNSRPLMSLLEDLMDPPDSFGLTDADHRHNGGVVGHVTWCSTLTNLRKGSHAHERPVCVCVTPFKIHLYKVDQLRGDAGVPKLRYFAFVPLSDVRCFVVGAGHLYLRVVDGSRPSSVVVLLTFNRIKTESFLEHVKKASRRNIPFLDDYEDPVVMNASLHCELQIAGFLRGFEGEGAIRSPPQIRFYQLAQFVAEEEDAPFRCRTSAVVFTDEFFYVLLQDFVNFPRSANNVLEFVPSRSPQHRVAAIFPLTCSLYRIRHYDGETIDKLETNGNVPDFLGYGLELYFSLEQQQQQQQFQLVSLRWPTSCMRQEFISHLHRAFESKKNSNSERSLDDGRGGIRAKGVANHRRYSAAETQRCSFGRAYVLDEKLFQSDVSC